MVFKMLLAEQSPFAVLTVENVRAEPTAFQNAINNSNLYSTYSETNRFTAVATEEYSISTLPDTLYRLPKNTIFDYITLVRNTDPDYRFITVASKPSQIFNFEKADNSEYRAYKVVDLEKLKPSSYNAKYQKPEPIINVFTSQPPVTQKKLPELELSDPLYNSIRRPITLLSFPQLNSYISGFRETNNTRADSLLSDDSIRTEFAQNLGIPCDVFTAINDSTTVPLNDTTVLGYMVNITIDSLKNIIQLSDIPLMSQRIKELFDLYRASLITEQRNSTVSVV